MLYYLIDLFGSQSQTAKLRFFGPHDDSLAERPFDAEQWVAEIRDSYRSAAPNLQAIGRKLHAWLDGSSDR